jgi:HSP20 family protein
MLPIRFDPMRELSTLQREMDDLFKRMFGSARTSGENGFMKALPAVNSYIKDNVFHLEAELPGVDTDKLEVRMDGLDLVIHGERHTTKKTKDVDYLLQESSMNTFERRMTLPAGVDIEKAHASYKDGLLEVTVPISEAKITGRKIPIEGGSADKKSKEIH